MKPTLQPHHTTTQTSLKNIGTLLIWLVLGFPGFAQSYRFISIPNPKSGYGSGPTGLIRDDHGNLFATNVNGPTKLPNYDGTVVEITASGTTRILHTFHGSDGDSPWGLFRDENGNLYGTTEWGGGNDFGVVYKITPAGTQKVLHSFQGSPDGDKPISVLVRDSAGNLYGTTLGGGTGNCIGGCGTVFKIDPSGTESVVYSFLGEPDGAGPSAGLLIAANGDMYGTTIGGGTNLKGTVFKIDAAGHESVVYRFQGGTDGGQPNSSLVQDAAGNLYGVTQEGGVGCGYGCGTVFKIDPSGTESVVYAFTGGGDGDFPRGNLVLDTAGNLYGTTGGGGNLHCPKGFGLGCGTVFRLTPDGTETTIHTFEGQDDKDGAGGSALLIDPSGRLYGATSDGGTGYCAPDGTNFGCGAFFRLDQ